MLILPGLSHNSPVDEEPREFISTPRIGMVASMHLGDFQNGFQLMVINSLNLCLRKQDNKKN